MSTVQFMVRNVVKTKSIKALFTSRLRYLSSSHTTYQPKDESNRDNTPQKNNFLTSIIPKPAVYLGFSGAIPFVSLALASFASEQYLTQISTAQLSYAACILTFLGGVHWGKELVLKNNDPSMYTLTISVIPSLYAWSAFCLPQQLALYYLSAGLVAMAAHDVTDQSLPQWYRKLRIPLTLLAASSVAITGYNVGV